MSIGFLRVENLKTSAMTKKDLFIVHLLQTSLQGVADNKIQVMTYPITHKIENDWCIRLDLYVYDESTNSHRTLLGMAITGLELRWMAIFLSYCGYVNLSKLIERHRRKYYEDIGFHVQVRPSLLEKWSEYGNNKKRVSYPNDYRWED